MAKCRTRPSTKPNSSVSRTAGMTCMFGPTEILVGQSGRSRKSPDSRNQFTGAFDDHERIRQRRDEDVAVASEQRVEVRAVHRDRAVGEVDDARTLVGQHDADADGGDEGALDDGGAGQEVEPVRLVRDEEDHDDRGQTQQDPLGHLSDRALNDCPLCVCAEFERLPSGTIAERRSSRRSGQLPICVTSIGLPSSASPALTHCPSTYC